MNIRVMKNVSNPEIAFQIGSGTLFETELLKKGLIKSLPEDCYEVFSQEAVNDTGQICCADDYIKIDSKGVPYPVRKEIFESKHEKKDDKWFQKAELLDAWYFGLSPMEECKELQCLLETGDIRINERDPDKYYSTEKWGTTLSAAKDSIILFRQVDRDTHGKIADVNFSFVAKSVFDKTYSIVD